MALDFSNRARYFIVLSSQNCHDLMGLVSHFQKVTTNSFLWLFRVLIMIKRLLDVQKPLVACHSTKGMSLKI